MNVGTDGVPELPHGCGSWVVTSPRGLVYELYDRANVRRAVKNEWLVETAVDYLCRLNREANEPNPENDDG